MVHATWLLVAAQLCGICAVMSATCPVLEFKTIPDRSGCAFPGVALPRRCYVNRVTVSTLKTRASRASTAPLQLHRRLPAERKLSPELSHWGWGRPRVHLSAIDSSQGQRGPRRGRSQHGRIKSTQYSKCSVKLNAYHIPPTTGLKTYSGL